MARKIRLACIRPGSLILAFSLLRRCLLLAPTGATPMRQTGPAHLVRVGWADSSKLVACSHALFGYVCCKAARHAVFAHRRLLFRRPCPLLAFTFFPPLTVLSHASAPFLPPFSCPLCLAQSPASPSWTIPRPTPSLVGMVDRGGPGFASLPSM